MNAKLLKRAPSNHWLPTSNQEIVWKSLLHKSAVKSTAQANQYTVADGVK